MASGLGVRGTEGRCYGYYRDYKECKNKVLEVLANPESTVKDRLSVGGCFVHKEDYFECLHGHKEKQRQKAIFEELARQEHEAKYGKPSSDSGGH